MKTSDLLLTDKEIGEVFIPAGKECDRCVANSASLKTAKAIRDEIKECEQGMHYCWCYFVPTDDIHKLDKIIEELENENQ